MELAIVHLLYCKGSANANTDGLSRPEQGGRDVREYTYHACVCNLLTCNYVIILELSVVMSSTVIGQ